MIQNILDVFSQASGQEINFGKSSTAFNANVLMCSLKVYRYLDRFFFVYFGRVNTLKAGPFIELLVKATLSSGW